MYVLSTVEVECSVGIADDGRVGNTAVDNRIVIRFFRRAWCCTATALAGTGRNGIAPTRRTAGCQCYGER